MKVCKSCGIPKPLDAFCKAKTPRGERAARGGMGVESRCKYCIAEARSPGIHARTKAREDRRAALRAEGLKECTKCSQIKPLGDFSIRRASPDGLALKCRECSKKYATDWRAENTDSHKLYYAANKDRRAKEFQAWREENKDRRAEYMREWSKDNTALVREKGSRRRAHKLKATPKWANHEKIMEFYHLAERLTRETGVIHHVDHIYPLQSEEVCGLHCEFNLNVITQFENIQKLNRMPSEEYLQRCPK